jgi:hypothetical protein
MSLKIGSPHPLPLLGSSRFLRKRVSTMLCNDFRTICHPRQPSVPHGSRSVRGFTAVLDNRGQTLAARKGPASARGAHPFHPHSGASKGGGIKVRIPLMSFTRFDAPKTGATDISRFYLGPHWLQATSGLTRPRQKMAGLPVADFGDSAVSTRAPGVCGDHLTKRSDRQIGSASAHCPRPVARPPPLQDYTGPASPRIRNPPCALP